MTMRTYLMLPLMLLAVSWTSAPAGGPGGDDDRRRDKLRTILKVRDLRDGPDALLRQYLHDRDTLVRLNATLAYGSLQDTVALQDLLNNLVDAPADVEEAAAFAIGQTGALLGTESLASLEHDLIWTRLDRTSARARLIGEIGKFGTAQALTDLVLRLGAGRREDRPALLMSIARFAIRKVTTPEATGIALESLFDHPTAAWNAAYALQRIGDHPRIRAEVPRLTGVARHPDPLVRMQIAALFGKLKGDSTLTEPLVDLARFDPDWRVRVNAVRALGSFPPDHRASAALSGLLADENAYIVLAALAVAGSFGDPAGTLPEAFEGLVPVIRDLATGRDRGHRWQYRSEAATALARLLGQNALPDLRVAAPDDPLLRAGLLGALAATGSKEAIEDISARLGDGSPLIGRSALEALQSLARQHPADNQLSDASFNASIAALGSGDMAVTTTAAANLGDSLLLRRESVPALVEALGGLRSPADIEAIQEICRTLGKLGDARAVGALESLMNSGDAPAALAASGALSAITGADRASMDAVRREPLHVDFDFETLEGLPDTIAMVLETNRGEVRMEWYRNAAPFTILSLLKLAEGEGFYRGLLFHRVVPNFVVQGGDPRGDGWGGPGYAIRSEFSPLTYETGTIGIASAGKDTEGSQFFITQSPQPHLDGRYTIIGRVVEGMEVVDQIQVGDRILDIARRR